MVSASHAQEDAKCEAGKLLSARLHEARMKTGMLRCPFCLVVFDGTHCIKCPGCHALIGESFTTAQPPSAQEAHAVSPPAAPAPEAAQPEPKKPRRKRTLHPRKIFEKIEQELDFFTQGYRQYP